MTQEDLKIVDDAIQQYGDDFWNDDETGNEYTANRGWVIEELVDILKKSGHRLKLVEI